MTTYNISTTKTDLDTACTFVFMPTVFNTDFNNFAPITANQAWSLFFTLVGMMRRWTLTQN